MRLLTIPILLILLGINCCLYSQPYTIRITSDKGEKWWGGFTALGSQMPFGSTTKFFDLELNNMNNQTSPLLLSSKGRYIWGEKPFQFAMVNDTLVIISNYENVVVTNAGKTLREAYRNASNQHFPSSGKIPAESFFNLPQYNTWIELMYNQNQTDILNYAQMVKEHGFPPGIFMIDDNWQKYYGNYDFKPERFPDPKAMTKKLHNDGFQVMLWVCPYVSADSPEFRDLNHKGFLVKAKGSSEPAIISWWNGYSAFYDLTNPEVMQYLVKILMNCSEKYGVDGFKFDGADISYMQKGAYDFYDKNATIADYTLKWAELGLHFPYNEFRATWKMGGQAIVQRLGDKPYSWKAVEKLIPEMIAAGLLGHPYTCPDMIGGGSFTYFLNKKPDDFDQELIVRSAQVHALMPMMQFSVAPWRILDEKHLDACRKAAKLHSKMGKYIIENAYLAAEKGEPIVRSMEYMFPGNGYENIKDQFMLGERFLIAPMTKTGDKRKITLPMGKWKDDLGKTVYGPVTIEITVPIERLPYYELLD